MNLRHQHHRWIPRKAGPLRVTPYRIVLAWHVVSLHMKKILYLSGFVAVLATSGCIFPEGGRGGGREHERYERHDAVVVGPPAVVVRAPVLIVRPPEVIVR
jgi:hypothetical protein